MASSFAGGPVPESTQSVPDETPHGTLACVCLASLVVVADARWIGYVVWVVEMANESRRSNLWLGDRGEVACEMEIVCSSSDAPFGLGFVTASGNVNRTGMIQCRRNSSRQSCLTPTPTRARRLARQGPQVAASCSGTRAGLV